MNHLPTPAAAPTATPAARAPMRDVTGGAGTGISVIYDARSAYDFVFSLEDEAGSTDDLPAADRRWLQAAKAKLPQSLVELPHGAGAI